MQSVVHAIPSLVSPNDSPVHSPAGLLVLRGAVGYVEPNRSYLEFHLFPCNTTAGIQRKQHNSLLLFIGCFTIAPFLRDGEDQETSKLQ